MEQLGFGFLSQKKTFYNLIADIIDSSPNKQLTVSEIYKKISVYFESNGRKDTTWKNSVRHALSFKSIFKRLRNENKKRGCMWTIDEERRGELQVPRTKRNHRSKDVLAKLSEIREQNRQGYLRAVDLFLKKFYLSSS